MGVCDLKYVNQSLFQGFRIKNKNSKYSLLGDVTKDIKIQEVYIEQIPSVTLEKKQ